MSSSSASTNTTTPANPLHLLNGNNVFYAPFKMNAFPYVVYPFHSFTLFTHFTFPTLFSEQRSCCCCCLPLIEATRRGGGVLFEVV